MLLTESVLRKIVVEEFEKLKKEASSKYDREAASDRAARPGSPNAKSQAATERFQMMHRAGAQVMKDLATQMQKNVFSGFMFKQLEEPQKNKIVNDTLPQGLDPQKWKFYLENMPVVHK